MLLPQNNARLTGISSLGTTDDYDYAGAGDETVRWTGIAEAYYQEKRQRSIEGGEANVLIWRTLIVSNSIAVGLEFTEGETVTFTFRGESITARISAIERRVFAPILGTVRLTLETG